MRIVITGNSSGIGKMLAEQLENRGHVVVGLSRSGKFKCDVTKYEEVAHWAQYVQATYNGIDALITCAGIAGALGSTSQTTPKEWSETIGVNLIGTYNAIHAFYPMMNGDGRPKIICLSGGGAANARPFFSAYATSKAAVVRLVENIASEDPKVDINAIAPGAIKTNIINGPIAAGKDIIGEKEYTAALKQSVEGEDPAPMFGLVNWLLSSKSDGVTGRFISAKWDVWKDLTSCTDKDLYKLRRTT